ncbi:hypothetical protein ABW19_dt0204651 [Dactylella cylindrospora]|nr:hypothetical protein ABW19_dt0204651 [Dactylella cylindrospora]
MSQGLGSWVNPAAYLNGEPREPGARRAKIVGALRYANEARQNYIASYYRTRETPDEGQQAQGSHDGSWTDRDIRTGAGEEMVLFPTYARRRMQQRRPDRHFHDRPNPPEEESISEIEVRGWIFIPPSNVLTRKNRFLMGVARQLCGLPAQGKGVTEEDHRADIEFSRVEVDRLDPDALSDDEGAISVRSLSRPPSPARSSANLSELGKAESDPSPGLVKKLSWRAAAYASSYVQPRTPGPAATGLTAKELDTAHEFLRHRMIHVMARASPNTPVTVFFYNNRTSKSKTVATDAYGQFNINLELTFIPTHVRVLASERLSVTEEIRMLESHGVSLISDIDDTIKDSAVTAGVREMARNVFIRDYNTLTIPGITELYNTLAFLDVPIHYVSNSPWQLYPLIREYFKAANLPSGSFHLKQYQSVFQGIFEPVADRKKGSLDKILQDFPDRRFIMIGDSGEADLEVYVAVALTNPGRIKAIFIRDVTTKDDVPFFEGHHPSTATLRPQHTGDSDRPPPPPKRPVTIAEPTPISSRMKQEEEDLLSFSSSDDDDDGPTILTPMEGHTMYPTSSQSTFTTAPSTLASTAVRKGPPPPPPKKPADLKGKKVQPTNHFGRSPPRTAPININRPSQEDLIDVLTESQDDLSLDDTRRKSGSPHSPPGKSPSPPKIWKAETSAIFDQPRNPRYLRDSGAGGSFSSPNLVSNRPRPSGANEPPRFTIRPPTDSDKSTISRTSSAGSNHPLRHAATATGAPGGIYSNTSAATSAETWDPNSGIEKKEWLWRQRWEKARQALEGKGVLLVSWRKGGDILETAVKVVEDSKREMDHRYR